MERVLLFVIQDFCEFEIGVALAVLRFSSKFELHTASLDRSPVTGLGGLVCMPHLASAEVNPADYAGLIVGGGGDWRTLPPDSPAVAMARAFYEMGKPIAAICAGTTLVARAGLLKDRRYTTSVLTELREELGHPPESCADEDVVIHGQLLTARGRAFVEFGIQVGSLFGVYDDQEAMERTRRFFRNERATQPH